MTYSVQYINGYEVLALPANRFNTSIEVNEFRADLSDGFRVQTLYGSSTGTRSWNLSFNAMRNKSTPDVTDGDLELTAAQYIYDLFLRSKTNGTPFVIQDSLYDQYYLAEFVDSRLSYEQIFTTLFSTGLNLRQARLPNVSVFDVAAYPEISAWYKTPIASATDNNPLPSGEWPGEIGAALNDTTSSPTYQTNELGSRAIVRLDPSDGADWLSSTGTAFHEAFLLMKVRQSSFSSDAGIISNFHGTVGSPALLGTSGDTKFYNLGFGSGYEYRKNGVLFAESNQQAPMQEFGVVHIRRTSGWSMPNGIVFGIDRLTTFPTRAAYIDLAEIIIADLLPLSVSLEITEHLMSYL